MPDPRTFKLTSPAMEGKDIASWQRELKDLFKGIGIIAPIDVDGVYGDETRSFTKSFAHAIGKNASELLEHGVTPDVRTTLRHRKLSADDRARMDARMDWRRRLRDRYSKLDREETKISAFLKKVIQDTWGYHPGVHDGIDLISLPDVPIYAPVKCKVIDVRADGWWNLGAPTDPALRHKGDGVVQLEVLEDVGPFKKGMHIGLGHAEKAVVKVGDIVKAGQKVANTGFANAWHIHLFLNDGSTMQGRGNLDPQAIVDYVENK